MKKLAIFLMVAFSSISFGYQDLLDLYNSVKAIKDAQTIKDSKSSLQAYQTLNYYANLRLWHLEQTQPRIFMRIETADNGTPIGYLRTKYHQGNAINKIILIKEYFNIND